MTTTTETTTIAPAAVPSTAATKRIRYVTPAVAIYEDAEGYSIEAEMPGVAKDKVHVTVENGELTFTGSKARQSSGCLVYGEAANADYRRVFDLDPSIDTGKITARMDQGVLTLHLPKSQDKKPRQIAVAG